MTAKLVTAAANNRSRLVAQLYDDWRGHYMLQQLIGGVYCDVRQLSRDEAMRYRCAEDESLLIVWENHVTQ